MWGGVHPSKVVRSQTQRAGLRHVLRVWANTRGFVTGEILITEKFEGVTEKKIARF